LSNGLLSVVFVAILIHDDAAGSNWWRSHQSRARFPVFLKTYRFLPELSRWIAYAVSVLAVW
jgi:hypothetical protein